MGTKKFEIKLTENELGRLVEVLGNSLNVQKRCEEDDLQYAEKNESEYFYKSAFQYKRKGDVIKKLLAVLAGE